MFSLPRHTAIIGAVLGTQILVRPPIFTSSSCNRRAGTVLGRERRGSARLSVFGSVRLLKSFICQELRRKLSDLLQTKTPSLCRTTTSLTLKGQRSRSRSRSRSRTRKCRNRFFGRSSVKNCPIDFGKDQNVPRSKYCHALSVTNGQSCVDHAHVTDS